MVRVVVEKRAGGRIQRCLACLKREGFLPKEDSFSGLKMKMCMPLSLSVTLSVSVSLSVPFDPWDMLNNFCFFMCKLKSEHL